MSLNKQTDKRAVRGEAQSANGLKRCSSCTRLLSVEENFNRNRHMKDGLQNACKACKATMSKNWKYAFESGEFDRMIIEQQGRCAICNDPMLDPNVDHDHATGRIRQLLCRRCNRMIGFAVDNLEILQSAIDYLRKWKEVSMAAASGK